METSDLDGEEHRLELPIDGRLDKALAAAADSAGLAISRSRIAQLIASGAVLALDGAEITEPARKVKAGTFFNLQLPPPTPTGIIAQDIPLDVRHEDDHLIVVNKPAGMVVHPAPGAESGTLVNALLAHCGDSLRGIGGEARPGIVHRIDKDTSGLLVAAKSGAAHTALAAQFADHNIHRRYQALVWGYPDRADPRLSGRADVTFAPDGWARIETPIGRHPKDRKKMAVVLNGRRAITYMHVQERFGIGKPFASLAGFQLETGRTHQIRVHAAEIGHALVGDPVYGRPRALSDKSVSADAKSAISSFPRQALHAAELGFKHPITGSEIMLQADFPKDMNDLLTVLRLNV
ncbi:MAG: RluA family pseudouridine synthase [Pseudomonadota bacterium]